MRKTPLLLALVFVALARPAPAGVLAIAVGDSIVATYPDSRTWVQGWGADLAKHFGPGVQWRNYAEGGASTKSFIDEGSWANTLAANPQFLLIQFGMNDSQLDPAYHTDPNTTYRANLHQMIVEARAIGAEPILVTPTAIRIAAADGFHVARPNGLEPYVDAMLQQASADGAHVIDMQTWSLDLYDQIGIPTAQEFYGFIIPGGTYAGDPDTVHFSRYGADQAALMVVHALPGAAPTLAAYLLPESAPALPPVAAALLVAVLALAVARESARGRRAR